MTAFSRDHRPLWRSNCPVCSCLPGQKDVQPNRKARRSQETLLHHYASLPPGLRLGRGSPWASFTTFGHLASLTRSSSILSSTNRKLSGKSNVLLYCRKDPLCMKLYFLHRQKLDSQGGGKVLSPASTLPAKPPAVIKNGNRAECSMRPRRCLSKFFSC